jgi:Na+-driven multidrug efflux pump
MTQEIDNPLGTQPIGKLLKKFAVPSIISMIVMSLYSRPNFYRTNSRRVRKCGN